MLAGVCAARTFVASIAAHRNLLEAMSPSAVIDARDLVLDLVYASQQRPYARVSATR
jgi:hypothetical protein